MLQSSANAWKKDGEMQGNHVNFTVSDKNAQFVYTHCSMLMHKYQILSQQNLIWNAANNDKRELSVVN